MLKIPYLIDIICTITKVRVNAFCNDSTVYVYTNYFPELADFACKLNVNLTRARRRNFIELILDITTVMKAKVKNGENQQI